MANYRDAVNFIQEWEGGISGHPEDNASSNPSPCGNDPRYNAPIHTNKGVTWQTFVEIYGQSCDTFLEMPEDVWLNIYKTRYWDRIGGDGLYNQAIANTYASWAWGSGVGGADNEMRQFLMNEYGYSYTDVALREQRILILNWQTRQDPERLFFGMMDWRRNYLNGLSDATVFGNGWNNRLDAFIEYNKKYITTKSNNDLRRLIIALTLFVIAVLVYFILIK